MTLVRHPRGNGFVLTCDTCHKATNVRGDNAFDVARTAKHAGWTIAAHDRCRTCPAPEVGSKTKARTKR